MSAFQPSHESGDGGVSGEPISFSPLFASSFLPLVHRPLPAHICYVITYHAVPRLVEFRRRSWCLRWLCWSSMLPSPPPSHAPLMHSPLPAHICYVITYHTVPRLVEFRRRSWCWRWLCWSSMLPFPPSRSCTTHCRRISATSLPTTRYLVSWNLGDVAGAGAGFAGRVRDLSLPPAHAPRTAGAYLLCHYLPRGTSSRGI
jgi:hypothetical protein